MAGGSLPTVSTKPSDRGLDIFAKCEVACRRFRNSVKEGAGVTACRGLQVIVLTSLDFVHNLPLQKLNDRLKLYPFVDPLPFDNLLTEIVAALAEWLQFVTSPDWLIKVTHAVAALRHARATRQAGLDAAVAAGGAGGVHSDGTQQQSKKTAAAVIAEVAPHSATLAEADAWEGLSELAHFSYPMPLKLRDLQAMIRPFMEVRSTHHIAGLDAIVSELTRALLRLFHVVQAWDETLVAHVEAWADAESEDEQVHAMCALCAVLDMDTFEVLHRFSQVPAELLPRVLDLREDIARVLPQVKLLRMICGPPTLELQQDGWVYPPSQLASDSLEDAITLRKSRALTLQPHSVRQEAYDWWCQQGFMAAAPTDICTDALLQHVSPALREAEQYVVAMLRKVLRRLFGVHMSCAGFLNKLLPTMGGYVASFGHFIPIGYALPLLSDIELCAETLVNFLQQWQDVVAAVPEREPADGPRSPRRKPQMSPLSEEELERDSGHKLNDVLDLLQGDRSIPENVLNVPAESSRYQVDLTAQRLWELQSELHCEIYELLDVHHRDLGPYEHIVAESVPVKKTLLSHAAFRPGPEADSAPAANRAAPALQAATSPKRPEIDATHVAEICDSLGLKVVSGEKEMTELSGSKFISQFPEGSVISRASLKKLTPLPWCLGSDERNSVKLDIPGSCVAGFHSIFSRSMVQRNCVTAIPLGGSEAPTYIVCPKYQPVQLHNGVRLVCQGWTFEIRIIPAGTHSSTLSILTDEGTIFHVPVEGCHIGAGDHSSQLPRQPDFPATKLALKKRLDGIAPVHVAIHYRPVQDRWTAVDHSPDPYGTLLMLKTGMAFPLSVGLRVKLGPVVLEPVVAGDS